MFSFTSLYKDRIPFSNTQLRGIEGAKMFVMNAKKDSDWLHLAWTFPPDCKHDVKRSLTLISRLLEIESKGSICKTLVEQGLIHSISSEEYFNFRSSFKMFEISVNLTKEGRRDYLKVIGAVFSGLKTLASLVTNSRDKVAFFEEAKIMGDLAFQFYESGDQLDNVTRLSEELCQTSHKHSLLQDCYK